MGKFSNVCSCKVVSFLHSFHHLQLVLNRYASFYVCCYGIVGSLRLMKRTQEAALNPKTYALSIMSRLRSYPCELTLVTASACPTSMADADRFRCCCITNTVDTIRSVVDGAQRVGRLATSHRGAPFVAGRINLQVVQSAVVDQVLDAPDKIVGRNKRRGRVQSAKLQRTVTFKCPVEMRDAGCAIEAMVQIA